MNEYRIMIVDDEPDILNLLEKALNIEGFYHIIKIDNGITAVNICEQNQPDIIIYSSHYFSNYNWKKVVKLPVNTIL